MTDLTEQWKKGELPSGWYWVEGCRNKEIYAYTSEYLNHMYRPKNSDRIIEQVPSYDKWKELKEFADYSIHNRDELTRQINFWMQENTKLKELLKECKRYIDIWGYTDTHGNLLLPQIDQALGEDK